MRCIVPRRRRGSLRSSLAGSAAIEFGIVAPVLVILFVAVAEVGYTAYQAMQVQNAAEAGALYAIKNGWDSAKIGAAIVNATNLPSIAATPAPAQFCGCAGNTGVLVTSCTSTCESGDPPGQYIQIDAALTRQSIIPGSGLPLPTALSARSIVRLN